MRRAAKAKGQESTGCSLLSPQENQRLEDLLGRRCAALSSGVAQLLMALPSEPNRWTTQQSGVVCFVKDSHQRSFFIRLYDLKAGKLVWEQEIYNQLMYQRARPFFHTFPGDDCQVGLNFADVTEAENFFTVVEDKISQRNNRIDKKHRKGSDCTDRGALPPLPPPNDSGPFTSPAMPPIVQVSTSKSKKEKKEKEKKNKKKGGKLLKGDIGAPSGFTHVSHCGMGSTSNDLDPDLKKLLSCAGISEADMDDSETSQLIYDVIERSGGMEAVKKAMHQEDSPRPPLPGGHRGSLPQVPPGSSPGPPPSQGRMGPLPPIPGQSAPPSHRGSLPPTPPRPVGLPQTPDGRGAPLPARSASLGPLPAVPAGGRTGPLPQPPGARSGALPPPPGGRSGGLPQPPLPGERRESLAPIPGKRPGAQMSERRGSSLPPQPMEPARPPLPPGGRSAHLPPPPRNNSGFFPPPPKSEMPLPPPSSDFLPPPPCDSFLPPPPEDFHDSEPPPPPTQSRFPPRSNSSGFGPPPPPVSTKPSGGGPPPPPPPPPPAAPPAAPPPMNFGSSSSSPAAPAASSGGEVGRGALLAQIQTGMKLKKVTANPEPPSPALDTGEGIVGALMMVMQKRSKAIHSSDEDDEFDDEEEDDEEWD